MMTPSVLNKMLRDSQPDVDSDTVVDFQLALKKLSTQELDFIIAYMSGYSIGEACTQAKVTVQASVYLSRVLKKLVNEMNKELDSPKGEETNESGTMRTNPGG